MNHIENLSSRRVLLKQIGAVSGLLLAGSTGACSKDVSGNPFIQADDLIRQAVKRGDMPGAVLAVGHGGKIVHRDVFGYRSLVPEHAPMEWDTVFDMASLTKVVVTALAIMQLWEQKYFLLDDPVSRFLPDFGVNGKEKITIRQLLTHYSGLPPDVELSDTWSGKEEGVRRAFSAVPVEKVDTKFIYSDINFIVLGLLVEHFSRLSLKDYAHRYIFNPLKMNQSTFLPLSGENPDAIVMSIAPTQRLEDGTLLRGVVHDPTSRRMGGVTGHAGLFSDAHDMALYAQALLDRRAGRPSDFPLARETVVMMTTPQSPAGAKDVRGLGWDIDSHYSTPRGDVFPVGSFGHTGFTGTSVWMDPASDSWVVLLTNRVHPSGGGGKQIVRLRHDVATIVARALL